MKRNAGMTLVELIIVTAVLTMLMGMLYTMALTLQRAAADQESKITTEDDVRGGMLVLVRQLRQSATSSIDWSTLPGPAITFRKAEDVDGNGLAVDQGGFLELSGQWTIQRDVDDLNNDGQSAHQLILTDGSQVTVLANGLILSEDGDSNGVLTTGEDSNGNEALDRGVWFEPSGTGVRVTLQAERVSGPRGTRMLSTLSTLVLPRN